MGIQPLNFAQESPPRSMDEAIADTVYRSEDKAAVIAGRLGVSSSTLSRWAEEGGPERGDLTLRRAIPLVLATADAAHLRNPAIPMFLAHALGGVFLPRPPLLHGRKKELLVELGAAVAAFSQVIETVSRHEGEPSEDQWAVFAWRMAQLWRSLWNLAVAAGITLATAGCWGGAIS